VLTLFAGQAESLWDEALPVEVRELPEDLAALDRLLLDPGLLGPIVERWRWEFEQTGRLAGVYGPEARVNSRHHQGITRDRLAEGLRPVAASHDDFVEAMESDTHRWVAGVQWHPERPEIREESLSLFRAFVTACRPD